MVGLTKTTFLAYIVPPFVCQYLMGVLMQLEGTHFYRLALLPIAVWLAWRATCVDMSGGDASQVQANSILIVRSARFVLHPVDGCPRRKCVLL